MLVKLPCCDQLTSTATAPEYLPKDVWSDHLTETPTAAKAEREDPFSRLLHTVGVQNVSLIAAIVVLVVVIGSKNSSFYLASNLKTIGMAVPISGLLAVVQTVVIIMGGIDLTVGSVAGLASVTSAMVFVQSGSRSLSVIVALLIGVLLNGMSLLGVNPFWQNVVQGTLLVAAVTVQQLRNGERRVGLPK